MMNRRSFERLASSAAVAPALPQFSVMLWTLPTTLSTDARLEIIAAAGYHGVELIAEYKKWTPAEFKQFKKKVDSLGLVVDSDACGTVPLADPEQGDLLKERLATSIGIAKELGCPQLIFLSGSRVPGQAPEAKKQSIVDNLKRASDIAANSNIEILLEPIDLLENKNASVNSVAEGFDIVRAVARPNVKVLYDFYHEQRGAGNVIEKLNGNIDLVGLVHIADVPERSQPGTGEMNYANIYRKLGSLHYNRYIAMEFRPKGDPLKVLTTARMQAIDALAEGAQQASQGS
jgi:hydroxypyruvate isomerase